jgi:hypothetical protein
MSDTETLDDTIASIALVYHLDTRRACLVMLSADEHGANLDPGHPKNKFWTRKSLFFRKIFFGFEKVTKTGKTFIDILIYTHFQTIDYICEGTF